MGKFEIKDGLVLNYQGDDDIIMVPEGVIGLDLCNVECEKNCKIMLPSTLKKIRKLDSEMITDILVSDGNNYFKSIDGVLYSKDGTELILFPKGKKIDEFCVPEGVTRGKIKDCCASRLVFPRSITTIPNNLNKNCQNIDVDEENEKLKSADGVVYSKDGKEIIYYPRGKKDKEFYIPEGVEIIQAHSFERVKELKAVCVPYSLVDLNRDILYCAGLTDLELKFPKDYFYDKRIISTQSISEATEFSAKDIVGICFYQSGKSWKDMITKNSVNTAEFIQCLSEKLLTENDIPTKAIDWCCEIIAVNSNNETAKNVKMLYEKLSSNEKIVQNIKKKFEKLGIDFEEQQENGEKNPIEEYVLKLLPFLRLHAETAQIIVGIPYKNSKKCCSKEALRLLVSEWIRAWDKHKVEERGSMSTFYTLKKHTVLEKSDVADEIASSLDRKALSKFLEKLVYSSNYRPFTIAYARYADEESMQDVVIEMQKRKKGQAKQYYWYENMMNSLYYSDTKAAAEYIEKYGDFNLYTSQRGVSVQEYRDRVSLPDFGFDESGAKKYIVEGKTISALITPTLELTLVDEGGKTIRTISKKSAEGERAFADYAQLKKDVKEFYKKRVEYMKKIYITAEKISNSLWNDVYLNNPLFRPLTETLIWMDDENNMFEVVNGKILDVSDKEIVPVGYVKVAHVLDMEESEIKSWQEKLAVNAKKLLIEQVWEPIADITSVSKLIKRYEGLFLSRTERNELKKALKAKAIDVRSETGESYYDHRAGTYVFDKNGTMLLGNKATLKYQSTEDGGATLGAFAVKGAATGREVNSIVFELDRVCIKASILAGNEKMLTDDNLAKFTLSQIQELIAFSNNNNVAGCTAILLDYKNRRFGNTNYLDSFVLDF